MNSLDIILMKDGQGVFKLETVNVKDDRLPIRFINAPPYSTVAIISENKTVRYTLSSKGETEINVSQTSGKVKFTVISKNKIWYCDGIYIDRDVRGNVRITTLVDYPREIERLVDECERLSKELSELRDVVKTLIRDEEKYNIV